jgi:hypothetical protein
MLTECPKCKDKSVVQRERAPDLFVWVASGWLDPDDGLEVEIGHCPWCGVELLDSDEYGELPTERPVLCICGHGPHAHSNDETACNGIDCWCRVFKLDVESVRPE